MKKSDFKRVIRKTLLMALFALLFFIVVLTVSKLIDLEYNSDEIADVTPAAETDTSMPDIVAEFIFTTDEEGGLTGLYLTELDCLNAMWRMSVVPVDSRLTLSTELYKECVKLNVATPQITTVSELFKCFDSENAVKLVKLAVCERLPIEPAFTLVMPDSVFYNIFRENPETYEYSYFLKEDLEEKIKQAGSMKAFMLGVLNQCECSPSAKDRLYYLETYEGLSNLRVSCRLIPGERHNNGYEIQTDLNDFFVK